jgi:hypothetical protein
VIVCKPATSQPPYRVQACENQRVESLYCVIGCWGLPISVAQDFPWFGPQSEGRDHRAPCDSLTFCLFCVWSATCSNSLHFLLWFAFFSNVGIPRTLQTKHFQLMSVSGISFRRRCWVPSLLALVLPSWVIMVDPSLVTMMILFKKYSQSFW